MVLRFSLQGEDVIEHIDGGCCVFTFWCARGRYSFVYNLVNFLIVVRHRHTPRNIVERTRVSALERQVSWGDTNGEVVDRRCNLANASQIGYHAWRGTKYHKWCRCLAIIGWKLQRMWYGTWLPDNMLSVVQHVATLNMRFCVMLILVCRVKEIGLCGFHVASSAIWHTMEFLPKGCQLINVGWWWIVWSTQIYISCSFLGSSMYTLHTHFVG